MAKGTRRIPRWRHLSPIIAGLSFWSAAGRASVTLLDRDDWKVQMGGFVELDTINDSTRSFLEVVGNNPVASGGFAGNNGRTQFSIRNTRLAFTVLPPPQTDWRTEGYLEFDLFGYQPDAGLGTSANPSTGVAGTFGNTESLLYTNPALRIRHAFFSAQRDGFQVLLGQYWTLFGWTPYYLLQTASVQPVTATLYERTEQVTVTQTIGSPEPAGTRVMGAFSITRPVQRDSAIPGLDLGLKLSSGMRRAGFVSPMGDIMAEPMSLAVSGTFRAFETPQTAVPGNYTAQTHYLGEAIAVNALLPILSTSDPNAYANTLALVGSFTAGRGYGDELPGWTGNLARLPDGTLPAVSSQTSLDPGEGGFDGNGNFQLLNIQTWNAQFQYHLPAGWDSFTTWGYGRLYSNNVISLVAAQNSVQYDRAEVYYGNFFHDFSRQIRAAIEFDHFKTHYVNTFVAQDDRCMASFWFRF